MRTMNILMGAMGVVGGLCTVFVAVPTLVGLGAGLVLAVPVLVVGVAAEAVGCSTLLTGLFGSDEMQF